MVNSSSRNGARVLWATVHTAEGIRKASDLKAFFERSSTSSAHAVADNDTLLDNLVPYDRAAWTLRNGNSRSDNLELCGFASWSRAQWLDGNQGMLNQAAAWIRSRCLARGIPIVKLTAADVRAGKAGVIGHVDYTNGTGDGTHWDPGPGFPWDVVIERAAQGDDMTPEEFLATKIVWSDGKSATMKEILGECYIFARGAGGKPAFAGQAVLPPVPGVLNVGRIDEIETRLTGVDTRLTGVDTRVQAIHTTVNAILAKLSEA